MPQNATQGFVKCYEICESLAEQSHGGRYFEVDEASDLPPLIPDLHEEIPIRSRPRTLWDNWIMLTTLLTLLTLEWGVRKWNRLL